MRFARCFLSTNLVLWHLQQVGSHDRLGTQVFPLKMLVPNEAKEVTLDLLKDTSISDANKKQRGQLFLELTYAPFREDNNGFSGVLDGYSRKDSVMDRALSNISTAGAAGLLLVTVQGAQDVEGSRHNNPYVLIIFRGETKKSKVFFISATSLIFFGSTNTPVRMSISLRKVSIIVTKNVNYHED